MSAGRSRRRGAAVVAAALLAAAAAGCGRLERVVSVPNQAPRVTITEAPRDTTVSCTPDPETSCYAIDIRWAGFDPDGRVDHYEVAVDPPTEAGRDTVWEATRASHRTIVFTAREPLPVSGFGPWRAREFHVVAVRAVDDRGLAGPPDVRAFFSFTDAPDVAIDDPRPSGFSAVTVAPSIRISWTGTDPDGVDSDRPLYYKVLLLGPSSEFPIERVVLDPGALRDAYAPHFAGWDSVSGDTTWLDLTGLNPGQTYLFAVVAFDEAGAYTARFDLNTNLLRFRVSAGAALGPVITAYNDIFEYSWSGEYCPCPSSEARIEVPAGQRFQVSWTARPSPGATLRSFRWAVDIEDLEDDRARDDEGRDLSRWSAASLGTRSVTLGPYPASETDEVHRLYIEARDNRGYRSLGIVAFQIVSPSFRPGSILVVKDTRFRTDQRDRATGCVQKPVGPWPTQAELDSFLFARGGHPWRCYPAGTLSRPGLFSGYRVDTLGTRTRRVDLGVRLALLSRYQHVVWLVDAKGAALTAPGDDALVPQTALRWMSVPGRFNTLAAYVRLGGRVWLAGGGGGVATTAAFDDPANNSPTPTFSNARRELFPSRMMYDFASWRSEFRVAQDAVRIRRFGGRLQSAPDPTLPYTGHLGELPAEIGYRTEATDPLPPQRTNRGDFYPPAVPFEFLLFPNRVVEAAGDTDAEASTLDTLYEGTGGGLAGLGPGQRYVVMTHYHGPLAPQGFVFSGFDLWSFRRADSQALVDFVLRRIWGLAPPPRAARASRF